MNAQRIAQNWLAHRVRRYHTNPHLAHIGQTNADHAHGVATLIAALNPKASADLLKAALWHDAGERWAGDLPQPFKAEYPDIAQQHRIAEDRMALRARPILPDMSAEDREWLKLADSLEAVMFAGFNRPWLLSRDDWSGFITSLLDRAERLGVLEIVVEVIGTISEEGWE